MSEVDSRHLHYERRKDRLVKKLHGRPKRKPRKLGQTVEKKTTFRVRARDVQKQQLVFFKTRTKQPQATVRRFATLQGFKPDRIKI